MHKKLTAVLSMLLCACLTLCLMGCGAEEGGMTGKTAKIQTRYLTLEFPAEYEGNLKHEEHVGAERTEEIFCMVQNGESVELFRVYFGDETVGSPAGYLHTESGVVSVTVQVSDSPEGMDEETEELYYGMMSGINTLLDSIYADKQFSEHSDYHSGADTDASMKYWSVTLPESITWEENTEGDRYLVSFYGTIGSERIKLYSVCIGDEEAENPLGVMEIDGQIRKVSVKVEGMEKIEQMSDEDQSIVWSMMDTINDVVAAIMSSEGFSLLDTE